MVKIKRERGDLTTYCKLPLAKQQEGPRQSQGIS